MDLQPHQQRVIDECAELQDKLKKLDAFLAGERFMSVPEPEKKRLFLQRHIMTAYALTLEQRIAAFE